MGAPQLRHELALIISNGALLRSSKFKPKNSIRNFALSDARRCKSGPARVAFVNGRSLALFAPQRYPATQEASDMSERLDTLKKARERMLEDRDAHAKVLAAPYDRDKAERARAKFVETQNLIDALDRAIGGE
jgi:Skp family chaperone for outer membrane proteins